ncbi:MAG: phytoene synthase [Mycobacterium sp.]|nr:phytoene synthase [Mycobacterium sp.]
MTPELAAAYRTCRRLHADYGRTYFLATQLLPAWKRPYVHALYGFARFADELVDDPEMVPAEAQAALDDLEKGLLTALAGELPANAPASTRNEVLRALADTAARWELPTELFTTFLQSMRMDLFVTEYESWDVLLGYVEGSAAVIGLQMLPILEPSSRVAAGYARDLGIAFQLANFLRDVGEDLRRGRIYLPQDSLRHFGVSRESLASGVVDGAVRQLLAYEIARCREIFRSAEPGIRLLHPTSRDCIRTAYTLYAGILDAIERADYQVLDRRVAVPLPKRIAVAGPGLVRAIRARRREPSHDVPTTSTN